MRQIVFIRYLLENSQTNKWSIRYYKAYWILKHGYLVNLTKIDKCIIMNDFFIILSLSLFSFNKHIQNKSILKFVFKFEFFVNDKLILVEK